MFKKKKKNYTQKEGQKDQTKNMYSKKREQNENKGKEDKQEQRNKKRNKGRKRKNSKKGGVEKGNENIYHQKRMQKERMKTQFFRQEERPFFFSTKSFSLRNGRRKTFLGVFS